MMAMQQKKLKFTHPYGIFIIFFIVSFYFSLIGNYVLYFTGVKRGFVDFRMALGLWFVGFAVAILTFFCGKVLTLSRHVKRSDKEINSIINPKKFSFTADIIIIIGVLATFAVFAQIGFIPVFVATKGYLIDAERFSVMEAGWLNRFVYLLSMGLVMKIFEIQYFKRRSFKNIMLIIVAIISFVLYGSKYLILMPTVVAILNQHFFVRKIQFSKALSFRNIVIFLIIFYASIFFTNYRGLGRLVSNDLISDVFIVYFPESTGMAAIVNEAKVSSIRGNPFKSIFYSAVPNEVFRIFGVNKHKLKRDVIAYKEIMGARFLGGSARIGLIGEAYVVYGVAGVVGSMLVLSILILFIHYYIMRSIKFSFASLLCVILLFQLCWLLVSEVSNNMPLTFLYLYAGVIIHFITKQRFVRNENINA